MTRLTRDTRVLIVGGEGGLAGGALRVDGIGIVDANDLARLECDGAIEAQRLDNSSVARYEELSSLHHTSDRNAINVVAKDLSNRLAIVQSEAGRTDIPKAHCRGSHQMQSP
jgi:hypothetical protein